MTADRMGAFDALLSEYRPRVRELLAAVAHDVDNWSSIADAEGAVDEVLSLLARFVAESRAAGGEPSNNDTDDGAREGGWSRIARNALDGVEGPTSDSAWETDVWYAHAAAAVSVAENLDAIRRSPEFVTALRCVPQIAMLLEQLNFPPKREVTPPQPDPAF